MLCYVLVFLEYILNRMFVFSYLHLATTWPNMLIVRKKSCHLRPYTKRQVDKTYNRKFNYEH